MHKKSYLPLDSKYVDSLQLTRTLLYSALLTEQSRAVWETYAKNKEYDKSSVLPVRAIARAMSAYENSTYGLEVAPQQYKDRVSRAVSTGQISLETLDLMCQTFSFPSETVKSLRQAVIQGFDASESLQIIQTIAQVMLSSSYFDLHISTDPESPGKFELHVTLTLLSLEAGCTAVLFPFGNIQEVTCESDQFRAVPTPDYGKWIFVSKNFIPPQETFMLRFTTSGEVQQDADGFYVLESPFVYKVFSTGIKINTGGIEREIRVEELSVTSPHNKVLIEGKTSDYLSHFCPVIDSSTILSKWK